MTVTMADVDVRRLGWWFLAMIYVVGGAKLDVLSRGKASVCATEMNPLKNVCYYYDYALGDQASAVTACLNHGGELAILDTKDTSYFVQTGLRTSFTVGFAWIGYNKDSPNWSDGSPFIWSNWKFNKGNVANERCVIVQQSDFKWLDFDCNQRSTRICQVPGVPTSHGQGYAKEEIQVGTPSLPRREMPARSKIQCGHYCLQDALCEKFNFHPKTPKCALYEEGAVANEPEGSQTFTF